MSKKIYEAVTKRILEELDAGVIPWRKPWAEGNGLALAVSHASGAPYSLINQMMLGGRPGEYVTFNQCHNEGGKVKKGAKAGKIIFWKVLELPDPDTGEIEKVPCLKQYNVFHISDCEGVKPRYKLATLPNCANPIEEAERVWRAYVKREDVRVFDDPIDTIAYQSARDVLAVPNIAQFETASDYYATLFHGLIYTTGAPSRLNRKIETQQDKIRECMTAEIGAAFLMTRLGIETDETFQNNAAAISNIKKMLNADASAVVIAAGRAQKAVEFILGDGQAALPAPEELPALPAPEYANDDLLALAAC